LFSFGVPDTSDTPVAKIGLIEMLKIMPERGPNVAPKRDETSKSPGRGPVGQNSPRVIIAMPITIAGGVSADGYVTKAMLVIVALIGAGL
jgi:hypothetical protein